jgi:cytochrome c
MRRPVPVLAVLACLAVASAALGQNGAARLKRAALLLERHCGACHAVGRTGASKRHLAVPLRELGRHYAVDSLQEALAEGLISGHPDMPEFKFGPDDVGAIIDYLKSIQVR